MKILLTGGGTGGHFYPVIAVAEAINQISKEEKLLPPSLYFMSEKPYNVELLYEHSLKFVQVPAGKIRPYFSFLNFLDFFKTGWGIVKAIFRVFTIYPDVIFGKGGYASFPALFAGKLFRIPVIIHESDIVPGKVNLWASKFAEKIAVSFPESIENFGPKNTDKIAVVGNPIRENVMKPLRSGAHEFLKLNENIPTIFILGGSQGSKIINDTLLQALPRLLEKYQIIHQTGKTNFKETKMIADVILTNNKFKDRYKTFEYLDELALRMSAGVASIVVSRAGSSIFEIASWKTPAILIPIRESHKDHQRKNAFAYARFGAGSVIEEINLTPSVLYSEISRILDDAGVMKKMSAGAEKFAKVDSAKKIARELLRIALQHES
ncbi:MAG: UDP-N-acetylglucosamine--N-acetylmuramyl-(pentapeptide) pyrophosphoryl-undecaprenol N-acetylglucosamine transferase [Patescibacteria group bacterium]